jgi:leader peptidase (prepilin peptidase)/N-methyltransferase
MGEGDAKLLAALGAWVGLSGLGPTILIAALLGLSAALVMRLRGGAVASDTKLPLGACLAAAAWVVFLSS